MPRRATTLLLQIGVVAVVFAALPYRLFELDRYFVPKELVLHVAALLVGALLVFRARRAATDAADALLAVFLLWSAVSALFATNYWLAQRALGVSASSALLFWGARQMGAAASYRPILAAAGVATVCAAVTGLAQAYGFVSDWFSLNRAPGGTFGNRNFVAHFAAIGLPALIYTTVTARSAMASLLGSLGIAAVAALLVLTRTRAAWLAVAASLAVLAFGLVVSRKYWGSARIGGRLARSFATAAVAVIAAMFLPNNLNWRSDSPYLDSALGVMDYSSGSGRGRVAQYLNSMRLVAADPVFGAGPGNWPVRYVRFAPPGDKSLTDDGMTANPWPSSDWVAYMSERGGVAAVALLGALLVLFLGAFRGWRELTASGDRDAVLARVTLAGTIVATGVVSAFDAVLLLAAPAFLAWIVIGAASGIGRGMVVIPSPSSVIPSSSSVIPSSSSVIPSEARDLQLRSRWWTPLLVAMLLVTVVSVARSATQQTAIYMVGNGGMRAGWVSAAAWDPGSYRIALRVAELRASRGQCALARAHARRASDLFPHAAAPRRILQRCS